MNSIKALSRIVGVMMANKEIFLNWCCCGLFSYFLALFLVGNVLSFMAIKYHVFLGLVI